MTAEWQFAVNTFLVSTVRNNKRAMQLSLYHHAVLKEFAQKQPLDPDYGVMLARYAPVHQLFADAMTRRGSEDGKMQGGTLDLKHLLTELRGQLNTWQAMVKVAGYPRRSAEYKALFPKGVIPYSNGAKDARIATVGALIKSMEPYTPLNAVRALVEDFHQQLTTARKQQVGHKGNKKHWAVKTEEARKAVLTEQYRNLGRLMEKFADEPHRIKPFFDLKALRHR